MKGSYLALIAVLALLLALPLVFFFYGQIRNPQIVQELRENPMGERAGKVMLIKLPSGREIPVNYLREGNRVYAGADGRWWKELETGVHEVRIWLRGEELEGRARAVLDDPEYTKDVFSRLRPTALPGFGRLIEIRLDPSDPGGPPGA